MVGGDLLEVFQDSLCNGQLPLSCRRAVITLLLKKGNLQDLKNWKPVALLCGDCKIITKALASRLKKVMSEVIHIACRIRSDNITFI